MSRPALTDRADFRRTWAGRRRPSPSTVGQSRKPSKDCIVMKTIWHSLMLAGPVTVGGLATPSARAQAFGFGYAGPGLSFGFASGGAGYYGGGYYGGYPAVVPAPVVVA